MQLVLSFLIATASKRLFISQQSLLCHMLHSFSCIFTSFVFFLISFRVYLSHCFPYVPLFFPFPLPLSSLHTLPTSLCHFFHLFSYPSLLPIHLSSPFLSLSVSPPLSLSPFPLLFPTSAPPFLLYPSLFSLFPFFSPPPFSHTLSPLSLFPPLLHAVFSFSGGKQ